jgi:hypothetical protein
MAAYSMNGRVALMDRFALNGELFHVYLCYRDDVESTPGGSHLGKEFSASIRSTSEEKENDVMIPDFGWGAWPRFARKPIPFRRDQAGAYLCHSIFLLIRIVSISWCVRLSLQGF